MKTQLSSARLACLLFLVFGIGHAHAQSDVFVCVNENGIKEYKNNGATKGCKRVDLQGVSMIASPYKKPLVQTASAKPASTPADFPKIDSGTQKARDSDRLQILSDEMKNEEKKLAALKTEFNNEPERRGDERNYVKYQDRVAAMKEGISQDISRTEKNIEALRREIGNLK